MENSSIKLAGAISIALFAEAASAQTVETLSTPTKASVQTIGKSALPPEPKPVLSLGTLRTTEAELPDEEQTYEARIALRYERERAREQGKKLSSND